jgi:septum site-determining protein MinC
MAATPPDYEPAGELKFGQVGIANLRVRRLDVERLAAEMRERVKSAPKLFARAAVVLDFGGLSEAPDAATIELLDRKLREAGVFPVAMAYGTSAIEALSRETGLPLLAKFRASYERTEKAAAGVASAATEAVPQGASVAADAAPQKAAEPGLMHLKPVRSGQQVYAQQRDLVVCATVGAGAEAIADGSIHIYGALRGRALAGAGGWTAARIFCREFHAELVAIAGVYKVLEEIPKALHGQAVQIWLEDEQLRIEKLA